MGTLILVRHGESEWNKLGLWTGHTDVGLTDLGIEQARTAAEQLRDLEVHICHTSSLGRVKRTWELIRDHLGWHHVDHRVHDATIERDYGELTGKNKWQIQAEVGEELFQKIRRSWDYPVPGGETLKDVHTRMLPYFETCIRPDVAAGKNVMLCSHGNTLRALVKHLEEISDADVAALEIGFGEVRTYVIE